MGLSLWFREDVLRILRALASAGLDHGPEYRQALYDVALAFGVEASLPPCPDLPIAHRVDPPVWQSGVLDWRH